MLSLFCLFWLPLLSVAQQAIPQPAEPRCALSPLPIIVRIIIAIGILAIVCIVGWRVIPSAFRATKPASQDEPSENTHS